MAKKRRGSALLRWLLCLGLPVGSLFGLFHTGLYERISQWPFGIGEEEVSAYASVFDIRANDVRPASGEMWSIATGQHTSKKKRKKQSDADWRSAAFSAEGYSDSVEVRRMMDTEGGLEIRFPKDNYFKAQRRILLLRMKDATQRLDASGIANFLKLAVPEREAVRVSIDGNEADYVAEEHIDEVFLDKRGYADGVVFTQGFNAMHPERLRPDTDKDSALAEEIIAKEQAIMQGTGDLSNHIDLDAAAAWLIMCDIEERRDMIMGEAVFAYDRAAGRIVPLYRAQRNTGEWRSAGIPVANIFSALLARADFRQRMEKLRARAVDFISLPTGLWAAFAEPVDLHWLAQTLPDPNTSSTKANDDVGTPIGNTLADIGERLGADVNGDKLSFVRGKYNITEDVITPPGTTVILGKGTRWFIAPGKRVEVNGTLIMNGTGPNPVFIRPAGDGPHGGITVNGADSSRCIINGLQMSGGGSKEGMLVFRNTDVVMSKSILNGSQSALVSIQKGAVEVSGCAFMRTSGDGLRLTNCTGKVGACNFQGYTGQANGDGLVVTGGRLVVAECGVRDQPGTGLLATSGADVTATDLQVAGCGTGVGASDGAQLGLDRCTISNNALGLRGLRTQQHRKGGTITVVGCTIEGNGKERELDDVSRVVEEPAN
ncbi:MAG: right-handed parallel beta-helix repeat-containing protein [Flavobacteriales bacterium]|nr:right-handed parallel beta-helix repeat-containing protein [Flavobacteriales bacterium]